MLLKQINLKNKEFLGLLDQVETVFKDIIKNTDFRPTIANDPSCQDNLERRDRFLSEEYAQELMDMGIRHSGKADTGLLFPMTVNEMITESPIGLDYRIKMNDLNQELLLYLGAHNDGLFTIYPPNGFIGWHNNADAGGYNMIITWSEKGEGYFVYKDDDGNSQYIYDKPGWQAKMAFFAPYFHETEKPMYHAAATDCWRVTLAYRFADANFQGSAELWEQVQADLESE